MTNPKSHVLAKAIEDQIKEFMQARARLSTAAIVLRGLHAADAQLFREVARGLGLGAVQDRALRDAIKDSPADQDP